MGYKNEFEFTQLLVDDNSDGRAACSTISLDIMAFRWEQNTQMVKHQVKNQKMILENKIAIRNAIKERTHDWKGT